MSAAPLRRLVDRYATEVCLAICAGEDVPEWVERDAPRLADLRHDPQRLVPHQVQLHHGADQRHHDLGARGAAFEIAQTRLGGGRIHHGMRTIAQVRKAFDLMLERAASRTTRHGRLADLQATQEKIADSWIEIVDAKGQVVLSRVLRQGGAVSGVLSFGIAGGLARAGARFSI